ncbi:ubiquitin domain-containing protein [Phanerochaete sordida]|uniref:Ubiquitin domain-containing protein n=1 Tax=Phanerochaete sordida TaxID=48140 RepID=A0A9P3FYZ6_9APHY|nr:ubiquitin domain-containing protein [Phanerochaete sordida]
MADQAEATFVKAFANSISQQPVTYTDDFQPPLDTYLKKVPTLPLEVPPPPEVKREDEGPAGAISIIIKSVKPPQSYTLSVHPADTIQTIKAQLAAQSGAPPADVQRLLLKGKALASAKLLKEYDIKDGDTVNLMVKPGFQWDPAAPAVPAPASSEEPRGAPTITLVPEPKESRTRAGHQRIPSVVLSPSPSLTPIADEVLVDIPLVLDTSNMPPSSVGAAPDTPYHTVVSQPEFWDRLYTFLNSEFGTESDAAQAWEDFFCASKGTLSVSEIAKIRDRVGVTGMAGT